MKMSAANMALNVGTVLTGAMCNIFTKRDYIRKLAKEAKQAEKAVKGLQSMIRNLESKVFSYKLQLEKAENELASGRITLDRYEEQKADIQKLIAEYQAKLEDKADKLYAKEQELERLTADAAKARSVVQSFRNHKVDFTPPRITEKVPLFGTDKWVERQNQHIAKQFTEIVRKIESLYRSDAARQVEAAQRNVLTDYGEFYQLKRENQSLSGINQELESELNTLLEQLAIPSVRNLIFAVADALIGGQPVPISSGGGGSTSDLPWDGRRPDEDEEAYRRRCLSYAVQVVRNSQKQTMCRKR